jgi:hypothetical protein
VGTVQHELDEALETYVYGREAHIDACKGGNRF